MCAFTFSMIKNQSFRFHNLIEQSAEPLILYSDSYCNQIH